MSQQVRVRFAPSPTGPLHIGGVRTALFNYLFARKHNGTFVLRIEDTDQNRYVPGAEDYIKESLDWCGIPYDEGPGREGDFGPYRQSERKETYSAFAKALLDSENAYYAFDTAEALDAHRKDHEAKGKTFIYNWHNRLKLDNSLVLSEEEVQQRIDAGAEYVIRFKAPQDEILELQDEIRGDIQIDTNVLDDKVLFKSDGMPTYHLANIVDDHLMEITHVIRGEEWLPSLALHVLLYRAFGWDAPKFAHLPLILKPVGKGKLSKRDGDKLGFPVFPLQWEDPKNKDISSGYREDGYFPEAVVNMLAFLGWNPGTEQEIFSLEELVHAFDLTRVNKAGAKFDPEKTKWFQQHYLQQTAIPVIANKFMELLTEKGVDTSLEYVTTVTALIKERAVFVSDLWNLGSYFFEAPTSYDEKAAKKGWKEDTASIMEKVVTVMEGVNTFDTPTLQDAVKGWITSNELGFGKVMQPLRLSLVGAMQGPDVFAIATTIGKEETIARIKKAIETL
ncbi:glutamate--tRNA ligase [uncultured Dokdonia sp.]|uniref:glutamate--tRNA ligase n=1 Tax=uncultured Dokdonia sp. TaxID=575653 RepID=UPI002614DF7C|nr:glutamate--tRNA ligase [uncultured Dokdonia sp.]